MFQNFNNQDDREKRLEKNLKLMVISAAVLIGLFVYTSIKSDSAIQGSSYYVGIVFLFILLILTVVLQKYKDKIRKFLPKDSLENIDKKFSKELEKANQSASSNENIKEYSSTSIKPVKSNITFKDVAGIQDIKSELEEIVDFLNSPKKYHKYGANLPKGAILVGPPGVGKTLIAKAVANEANVPFFYQSGASFVNIYVGMGAKKVRELFNEAKLNAPSIVFIDEIDAVGKTRGIGNNDEREATLNELLTQMDGFGSSSGVMVIAATNKIEVLDDALLRAGRFDRRIFLSLPSVEDRTKIINLYIKNKKTNFDIDKLASQTSGFSSAALATLINEALLNMIKRDGTSILEEDISLAKQKIEFGKKQSSILTDEQKEILAYYQAGKSFITKKTTKLFDSGINKQDFIFPSKSQLLNEVKSYLSGSITLEIIKNESYLVFEDELKKAYEIADKMVDSYKMEKSSQSIIDNVKDELKSEIILNKEEIEKLKNKLLKDEIVVF